MKRHEFIQAAVLKLLENEKHSRASSKNNLVNWAIAIIDHATELADRIQHDPYDTPSGKLEISRIDVENPVGENEFIKSRDLIDPEDEGEFDMTLAERGMYPPRYSPIKKGVEFPKELNPWGARVLGYDHQEGVLIMEDRPRSDHINPAGVDGETHDLNPESEDD